MEFQWATTRASYDLRHIEYAKALFPVWEFEYFRVCQSDLRIAISAIPMCLYCSARKFKLLDQRLVVIDAILLLIRIDPVQRREFMVDSARASQTDSAEK